MKRANEQPSNGAQGTSAKRAAADAMVANKNGTLKTSSLTKEIVWTIDDFPTKTESIHSPVFDGPTDRNKWFLQVNPYGTRDVNRAYVGAYLILKESPIHVNIAYSFQIGRRSPNDGIVFNMPSYYCTFKFAGESWGYDVMHRAVLFEPANGFLIDDKLTITCRITAFNPSMYDNAFLAGLERAFAEDNHKDCELVGNDGPACACKALLCSQSKVFTRMFQGELKEAETGKVEDIGLDQKVLTALVQFTHCGKTGDIREIAEDLFEAADKYEIKPLIALCAQHMSETLSKENACARLVIADRHRVDTLKNAAISMIKENISDIKELVGHKELLTTEHQDLVIEILSAIAPK